MRNPWHCTLSLLPPNGAWTPEKMWPIKPALPSSSWNPTWASCVSQVWWELGYWERWAAAPAKPAVCVSPSHDLLPLCHMSYRLSATQATKAWFHAQSWTAGQRMSLGLKPHTAVGPTVALGSNTAWPVLPTPQWHLGIGNGSPATALSTNCYGCKCSQDKEVINFQAAQLPDLAPCRSTKASTGIPDSERFKMLWPLPSWLLWCKFESPLSPAWPSPAHSTELSRCTVGLGSLPSVTA